MLIICAPFWMLAAQAEGFVEAVSVQQVTGLENTCPAWSPDGMKLVFESTPSFTPDGKFIVYTSGQDGNPEIYIMRVDGSEKRNRTNHPGADGHPRVSADGARISFNSNRTSDPASFARGTMERDQNHEIFSMTLAGGDLRRITDLPDWDSYPVRRPTERNCSGVR